MPCSWSCWRSSAWRTKRTGWPTDCASRSTGSSFPEQLAVRADVESPPCLSVGPHLDGPVAAPPGMQRLLEQQRVLHCGTGLLHGGAPGFDFRQHADFCHGPPQGHVALVGVVASQGGPRREKTNADAKEFKED